MNVIYEFIQNNKIRFPNKFIMDLKSSLAIIKRAFDNLEADITPDIGNFEIHLIKLVAAELPKLINPYAKIENDFLEFLQSFSELLFNFNQNTNKDKDIDEICAKILTLIEDNKKIKQPEKKCSLPENPIISEIKKAVSLLDKNRWGSEEYTAVKLLAQKLKPLAVDGKFQENENNFISNEIKKLSQI